MNEFQAVTMWTNGFGNMNDELFGREKPRGKRLRALKSDWTTNPMPRETAYFDLGIELTDEEFEELAWGHVPEEMEDHWFMYLDGEAFCFHRSWTGCFIYRVHVRRSDERKCFVITGVTVNRDKEQYGEESDERDAALVCILIGQALGRDVSGLWDLYFSLGE